MAQVRVILRDDVGKLGIAGELVSVKPGYARNYLVPQGLATLATSPTSRSSSTTAAPSPRRPRSSSRRCRPRRRPSSR